MRFLVVEDEGACEHEDVDDEGELCCHEGEEPEGAADGWH